MYTATLPPSTISVADALVNRIRGALETDLQNVPWLDAATRTKALEKLSALRTEVFAPSNFTPYLPELTGVDGPLAKQTLQIRRSARATSIARIGHDDARDWFMTPVTANAAYSPTVNALNLPAGILQAPMFDDGYAEVVRLGALGSVIGHEFSHAFDDQGRQYDAAGSLSSWWSADVAKAFTERAECLVHQYDAFEPLPGQHVNGQLTLGENIADLAGVKLSYAAAVPTTTLQGSFTEQQSFFVAYAQSWCGNTRDISIMTQLRVDPHSPAQERVNGVVANTPEFAAAFACQVGSKLAPVQRCAVW